jgi:adenine-specific DNA-methyltransferase
VKTNEIDFKSFPTTRYQGSKRKILPLIHTALKDIKFNTVLDACGGSGSVSYLFKKMGKQVTYNDKLKFNYLIGKAIIENSEQSLSDIDISNILKQPSKRNSKEVISKIFDGVYYLKKENQWLDRVASNIVSMRGYEGKELEYKIALSYYALFQSCLIKRPFNLFHRNNLSVRTNDVERNFGNKVTWERTFDSFFLQFVREANGLIFDNKKECRATNESIFNIDPYGYDLVYIDPPYIRRDGSNESSNYLKCYHFLEGLSQYKDWSKKIDYASNNLRLKDIDIQNDFSKLKIEESIEEILAKFRNNKIVFSYKVGGIPSIDRIKKTMKKLGKKVTTKSQHYIYALNHQNGNAAKNREVLIIGI